MATHTDIPHAERLFNRTKKPFVASTGLGLTRVAGTHGTSLSTIEQLVNDGHFNDAGADPDLQNTFYLTPNLRFSEWKNSQFDDDIAHVSERVGTVNPLDISREYAGDNGVVIGFGKRILDFVRFVDVDDMNNEPEVGLLRAPSIEDIVAIYPMSPETHTALLGLYKEAVSR